MDETDRYIVDSIVTETIDNGTIENVQIAPIGEYFGSDSDGNPIKEKLTVEALQTLADGLNATETEVLADVDHGASKPGAEKSTKAAGWFSKFIVDPLRGLFANLKLTRHGKELLENREYRYISPTFSLDKEGVPVELHTASLTNMPAFAGSIDPVLNQESKPVFTDKGLENMTKEELKDLIKETISEMKEAEKKAEVVEEVKEEIKEEKVDNACSEETEEVKNEEVSEEVKEEEVKEEMKDEETKEEEPEKKEEEKKEEVIKIEALNSAPRALASISSSDCWKNLHGDEFWKYLAAHPEIRS